MVGRQEEGEGDFGKYWEDAVRVWPKPKRSIDWTIPDIISVSLEEAERCFATGAYTACAVMCGCVLEGVCVHLNTKKQTLALGLKELRDNDIIDKRLYSWGEELRKARNLGAHASTEKVSRNDAEDILDFLHAIVNYTFVLNDQFEKFKARKSQKAKASAAAPAATAPVKPVIATASAPSKVVAPPAATPKAAPPAAPSK